MIETQNLNLARKWRPQTFEHVVGQDIAIRMLKNSLYLDKFFPVYLFAGQRGCGKTSTARIFAAAINCSQRTAFQQNPTLVIPCLTCPSCTAMLGGSHPDFIEIDAASHTGVDNVRQIIDASSYMPLIGQKKIYLIDEAHMLSKAAFNAFLKILEEPPVTVHFILATTEIPKIPPTVLSRCFQIIFNPIQSPNLKAHLQSICAKENIIIDDVALEIILNETEGSVRDAINLLERIRFSGDHISEQTILSVLGKISNNELFALFELILDQKPPALLTHLQTIGYEKRSPQLLWDMIVHLCRTLVWIKYGVASRNIVHAHEQELQNLAAKCSLNRLNAIMSMLWAQEDIFLKTNKKHLFLEMVLLQLCQQVDIADLHELIKICKESAPSQHSFSPPQSPTAEPSTPSEKTMVVQDVALPQPPKAPSEWDQFIQAVTQQANDPFLHSIFTQATFIKKDSQTNQIVIQLSSNSTFFKNKIEETKATWQPLLHTIFENYTNFSFMPSPREVIVNPSPMPIQQSTPGPQSSPNTPVQNAPARPVVPETEYLSVKNADQWPQSALLLSYFPGRIKKTKIGSI